MEELSRECLMETLDVFSGLKRIGGSEDEHRACGYLIRSCRNGAFHAACMSVTDMSPLL